MGGKRCFAHGAGQIFAIRGPHGRCWPAIAECDGVFALGAMGESATGGPTRYRTKLEHAGAPVMEGLSGYVAFVHCNADIR